VDNDSLLSKKFDADKILKTATIEELVEISKKDITEKRWERSLDIF